MDILIFLLVLSFLVIIHELGHFISAKKAGIRVDEFGIGYPPRALTLYKDAAGTEYTVNWLPFGGFVRLYGEDGPPTPEASEGQVLSLKNSAFFVKPVWQRLIVVLAGALINFVFGVLVFGGLYTKLGIPAPYNYVKVAEVVADSPAAKAGVLAQDTIRAVIVDGNRTEVKTSSEFIEQLALNQGKTVTWDLGDGNSRQVYVRRQDEIPEGQGATGVRVEDFEMKFYPTWQMPFRGMWVGLKAALNFGYVILQALGTMLYDLVTKGVVPKDVSGPIGIGHMVQKEAALSQGFMAIINFAAILSINLAIINILPFPALDGGRAVFLLFEGITRRRVKPEFEQWVNTAGFLLLVGLIMLISVRDVGRIVADPAVKEFFQKLF